MCRPWMLLFHCLFWMLLLASPAPALGQPPGHDEEMVGPDLDIKELAKARFEAGTATLPDLAKARRDALTVCFQIRKERYAAAAREPGINAPVTLNLLLETWAELVNAEWARSDKPDDRLAIQASHWLFTWETERFTAAQHRVGRVSPAVLLYARSARLTDEIKLRELLAAEKRDEPFMILPDFSTARRTLRKKPRNGPRRSSRPPRPRHATSPGHVGMLSEHAFKCATNCTAVARTSLEPCSPSHSIFSWIWGRS